MKKTYFRNVKIGLAASLLAACGASGEEAPSAERDGTLISRLGTVSRVFPGNAVVATSIDPERTSADELGIVEHQYPRGRYDAGAPVITEEPMRVDAHVALHGAKSNYLDNDAACDTLRVEGYQTAKALGIVSIGASADAPILMWPKEDGAPGEFAYLCFFEDNEPAAGAVVFVDNRDI